MLGFLKIAKWVLAGACVILVLLTVAVLVMWSYPSIRLETSGKNTIVHLETLSDYPTSIDRIVIAKRDHPDDIVLEARGEDAQIVRFLIHAGINDVGMLHATHGKYDILIPHGRTFVLEPNEAYRITVCEGSKCVSTRTMIETETTPRINPPEL